jgi:hypothetical protein
MKILTEVAATTPTLGISLHERLSYWCRSSSCQYHCDFSLSGNPSFRLTGAWAAAAAATAGCATTTTATAY